MACRALHTPMRAVRIDDKIGQTLARRTVITKSWECSSQLVRVQADEKVAIQESKSWAARISLGKD